MSRQSSGRYAVRSRNLTDILSIRNPHYRFTMLERWLPCMTARKLCSVVLKLLKVIWFIFKIFQRTMLCVSTFTPKMLTDLLNGVNDTEGFLVSEFSITIEIKLSSNPKLISTLLQRLCYCFPHRVSRGLSRSKSKGRPPTHSYTGRERYSNLKYN